MHAAAEDGPENRRNLGGRWLLFITLAGLLATGCSRNGEELERLKAENESLKGQLSKSTKDGVSREKTEIDALRREIASIKEKVTADAGQMAVERQRTAVQIEAEKRQKWSGLLSQILIKLERARSEDIRALGVSVTASREEKIRYLNEEAGRIKTLTAELKMQVISTLYELKALGYPEFSDLELAVTKLFDSVSAATSKSLHNHEWITRFGKMNQEALSATLEHTGEARNAYDRIERMRKAVDASISGQAPVR